MLRRGCKIWHLLRKNLNIPSSEHARAGGHIVPVPAADWCCFRLPASVLANAAAVQAEVYAEVQAEGQAEFQAEVQTVALESLLPEQLSRGLQGLLERRRVLRSRPKG